MQAVMLRAPHGSAGRRSRGVIVSSSVAGSVGLGAAFLGWRFQTRSPHCRLRKAWPASLQSPGLPHLEVHLLSHTFLAASVTSSFLRL